LLPFWNSQRGAWIDPRISRNLGGRQCMLVLFDHSTPSPLRHALQDHVVVEAVERGWESLGNGALLDEAKAAGFKIFVTADKNRRHQQNLAERKIAVIVLGNAQWPILRRYVDRVVVALNEAKPGSYAEIITPVK
jgi:hypothetical protein